MVNNGGLDMHNAKLGSVLGNTTDQFLRYNFSLGTAHRLSGNTLLRSDSSNVLSVQFDPSVFANIPQRWISNDGVGLGSLFDEYNDGIWC